MNPDYFVIYADMLGFRQMVTTHRTVNAEALDYRRVTVWSMAASLASANPLQRRFRDFHIQLDEAITKTRWPTDSEVFVMVFSDSLFIATQAGPICMDFCERLLLACIKYDVPVRIGVGHGSFISNNFSFESHPRLKVVSTQFLGTGVVHATDAEKAVKGIRIALHPSAAKALALATTSEQIDQRVAVPSPSEHVSHEWNYAPKVKLKQEDLVWQIRKMKDESPRSPDVAVHYDQTIDAIRRMVSQLETGQLGRR